MKMEMTQKDKKLLVFLAIFVIVAVVGYWGVYPMVKDIFSYNREIKEQQDLKLKNDTMIAELPFAESDNTNLEKDILVARSDFYPMMSSDEIDKMFTGMALEYGLSAYKLDIQFEDKEAQLEPYINSEKFAAEKEAREEAEEAGMEPDEIYTSTGIYAVRVSMRLGADDEEKLQQFVDMLSASEKKHMVSSYIWEENSKNVMTVNQYGLYEVNVEYEKVLNITVDLYMCQE